MSLFFDKTMQGLLEAVAIDKGEIPLEKKKDMPTPTLIAEEKEKELIREVSKNENAVMMSETEYNEMVKAKKNAEYLNMLDKSMEEAAKGGFIAKSIQELEKLE